MLQKKPHIQVDTIPEWSDGAGAKSQGLADIKQLLEEVAVHTPPTRTINMSVTKFLATHRKMKMNY